MSAVAFPREEYEDGDELIEPIAFEFGLSRRSFTQLLGAGLLVSFGTWSAVGQGRNRGGPSKISGRIHIGKDGTVTVLSGKVEMGQGARAELAQAAAEELRIGAEKVRVLLADTTAVPDDGLTAGSRTTPATVPLVRQGAAAAREVLVGLACSEWGVEPATLEVREGVVMHDGSGRKLSFAELAGREALPAELEKTISPDVAVTPVAEWKVLGTSAPRPNREEIVTGRHRYPSDMVLPGMRYGKVLRPPAYGSSLSSLDAAAVKGSDDLSFVRDGSFVGVVATSTHLARQAIDSLGRAAKWERAAHPSSEEIYEYLREHAEGGVPENPFGAEMGSAKHRLKRTYRVPYIQHAPMEPRAAVAEWSGDKLTVYTGTQNPFGYRRELARAFRIAEEDVRVVVVDFGGGFGGKHTGEAAIEAARLARATGHPVKLVWTREEEFRWAYFRPAAVIDVEASLGASGELTSWHFVTVNAGGSAIESPYRTGKANARAVGSESPLRQGSYRALAATANTFARECFMDELAAAAGADPLAFRLKHLEPGRLRAVLEAAAERFGWDARSRDQGAGIGLACGTEKGSYVATCAEVSVDAREGRVIVRRICEAFECGAILNPGNLLAQVESCIVMGFGPALREGMVFENGELKNGQFKQYRVPRISDLPELDIHLLNRTDLASAGAGETPMITVAPAIANAVYRLTGRAIDRLPVQPATRGA
jgi:isoquinoline 1-oxidoreductase